jgi:hypothetical protein
MNETELNRIEDALGRSLPATFRNVMLNFPQKLIEAATMTDPDGNEFIDSMMITPNADYIIGGIKARRHQADWPKDYLVVGDNGCGDDFSVDVSKENCPVFMSGPHNDAMASGPSEEGYFEQISDDLQRWVDGLANRAD